MKKSYKGKKQIETNDQKHNNHAENLSDKIQKKTKQGLKGKKKQMRVNLCEKNPVPTPKDGDNPPDRGGQGFWK